MALEPKVRSFELKVGGKPYFWCKALYSIKFARVSGRLELNQKKTRRLKPNQSVPTSTS